MKYTLLLGFLLLSSLLSISQTARELNEQFRELYNNADYEDAFVIAKKAIEIAKKAIEIAKKESKEPDTTVATSTSNLGVIHLHFNNDAIAEPLFISAMDIRKKILGPTDPAYAISVQLMGEFYQRNAKYVKAELFFQEVVNIRKKILPANHPDYAVSLHSLGEVYRAQGFYEKAALALIEAEEIEFRDLPQSDPEYMNKLSRLSTLYIQSGQYEKAEPLYIIAKDITGNLPGEEIAYAKALNQLASLYRSMYQYEKSETMINEAIEIYKKVKEETSPGYALLLYRLASLYTSMNNFEKAEPLFISAMNIYKTAQGKSLNYSSCLNGLGLLNLHQGNYKEAEQYLLESLAIKVKISGKGKQEYAIGANNLAELYTATGLYRKAEPLYFEALAIIKKGSGENNPIYSAILRNIAVLYSNSGQISKAIPLYLQNSNTAIRNLQKNFTVFSEKEKANYLNENTDMIQLNNSFVYKYKKVDSSMLINAMNQQLVFKSFSMTDTRNILSLLQQNTDSTIRRLFKEWQDGKILLSAQYALPPDKRRPDLKELETTVENSEKELSRKLAVFRNEQSKMHISLKDVRKGLQEFEVAIEFVRFRYYNKKNTDSVLYAAYILNKHNPVPVFIPLCEESQLQRLFDSVGKNPTSMVAGFYRGLKVEGKSTAFLGRELYKLVWEPLEPYLNGAKVVSYSPAGKLYAIAFQALPVDSSSLLMDKYQLQQYVSTREVALRNSENGFVMPANIVLFGDAMFSSDSLQLVKQKNEQTKKITSITYPFQNRSGDNNTWNSLPGTAQEVKAIQQIFDQNNISTKKFIQTTASEENLKLLSGNSPQILHIATHGFFLPQTEKKKKDAGLVEASTFSLADDPLLRSGLILSGGNYAWSGKTPIEGVEDGIATAYEISQLNLSNTELVVLSACETALGDVKGSEGVFGLQRAFKMAGVKKMIVSLWQVPDKETAELMTSFYSYWMKGKTINDAFTQAQAEMRKKYSPFYWAAFVLVE